MQKQFFVLIIFFVIVINSFAQNAYKNLPIDKTISQNEKIEIQPDTGISRIIINFQNKAGIESEAFWTVYAGDKEKPESEIGPKKFRLVTLAPKAENINDPIRLDKKELVLNTNNADKIVIRVEKGTINIQVKPSK